MDRNTQWDQNQLIVIDDPQFFLKNYGILKLLAFSISKPPGFFRSCGTEPKPLPSCNAIPFGCVRWSPRHACDSFWMETAWKICMVSDGQVDTLLLMTQPETIPIFAKEPCHTHLQRCMDMLDMLAQKVRILIMLIKNSSGIRGIR